MALKRTFLPGTGRYLYATGLALLASSCALSPSAPAASKLSPCSGSPATVAASSGLHVKSVTTSGGGLLTLGGSCTYSNDSPATPETLTIKRMSEPTVEGDIQSVERGYQDGLAIPTVGTAAVSLDQGNIHPFEACNGALCVGIIPEGYAFSLGQEEKLANEVLAHLASAIPPTPTPSPGPTLPNPCGLISTGDLSSATGWYLQEGTSANPATCNYSNQDDSFSVTVTVSESTQVAFDTAEAAAPSKFSPGNSGQTSYGDVVDTDDVTLTTGYILDGTTLYTIQIISDYSTQYAFYTLIPEAESNIGLSTGSPSSSSG